MATNGYFTEGKPSLGLHSSDNDGDSLSKEPLKPSAAGKNYDTIKGSGDGKCILILSCIMNSDKPGVFHVTKSNQKLIELNRGTIGVLLRSVFYQK